MDTPASSATRLMVIRSGLCWATLLASTPALKHFRNNIMAAAQPTAPLQPRESLSDQGYLFRVSRAWCRQNVVSRRYCRTQNLETCLPVRKETRQEQSRHPRALSEGR